MKKFVVLVVLLCFCSSAFALSGNLLKFTRPAPGNIIKTYPSTASTPSGGLAFTTSSAVSMIGTAAQIGIMVYTGGLGTTAASVLGGLVNVGINLATLYNSGVFNSGALGDVANSAFPSEPEDYNGVKMNCAAGQEANCAGGKVAMLTKGQTSSPAYESSYAILTSPGYAPGWYKTNSSSWYYNFNLRKKPNTTDTYQIDQTSYSVSYVVGVPDSFGRPATITEASPQEQTLAQKLAQALGLPEVQAALKSAIQQVPQALTNVPAPITNNQVTDYITNNNTYNQDYINYLTDLKNTYQGDQTWIDNEIAKAEKEQAKEEKEDAEEEQANAPLLQIPAIKKVDIKPITDLTGELSRVFPFGLVSAFCSGLSSLVAQPTAPSFTIDAGIFQKEINFSIFNSFASFIRSVMTFLIYGLTAFFCVRLFARM